ncbi:carboxypeptidase-like regulatory domain-containing protein [Pontibacter cellulosilyticus]|uniref:Carboxypeptidase-like regulatory domain-containing protein n=1 Tax=Pontibacter cellulosilyticus TaxID=1720253 RepID=A0A923SIH4_9BACT|nr:carboxypeptidase-like regulatory domain-containing protein [Pontibacter cellulosilyticus]MBC5992753.1 carboxypeptidase-like regulatory domain-containing protein [Pontibacter cellulosilyticus]
MKQAILLLLSWLIALPLLAQHKIQGRVFDEKTDEPIEFVSVYVNTTTIGATTNAKGEFVLQVPAGRYELIVSYLGYEPIIYQVNTDQLPKSILFKLTPKEHKLTEVVVEGKRDPEWYQNLEVFKQNFLGKSTFGRQCKLLNPEVLAITFDPKTALLEVKSDRPLLIENPALGYKIEYLLTEFKLYMRDGYVVYLGYPKYTLMKGGQAKQRRWSRNRETAYRGSVMHFVRALRQQQLEEQGFNLRRLYRVPNPNRPTDEEIAAIRASAKAAGGSITLDAAATDILARARLPKLIEQLDKNPVPYADYLSFDGDEVKMQFDNYMQVVYTGEKEEMAYVQQLKPFNPPKPSYQTSVISLRSDYVLLDKNGSIYEPLGVLFEGYWGFEKLGDMLPLDYTLPE